MGEHAEAAIHAEMFGMDIQEAYMDLYSEDGAYFEDEPYRVGKVDLGIDMDQMMIALNDLVNDSEKKTNRTEVLYGMFDCLTFKEAQSFVGMAEKMAEEGLKANVTVFSEET